jgi:hypothetical protein
MSRKLREECHNWGLKINVSKIEYLASNIDDNLHTEGHKIKKIINFCYLGLIVEQNGASNLEIEKRINYGRKVIGILNYIFWSSNILGKTKTIIYKSIVESILLYGSETWTLNTRQQNKLLATEMDY